MQMPITISVNSVSFPKSAMLSQRSRTSHNCGANTSRIAAIETKVRNRRFTGSSYQSNRQPMNCLRLRSPKMNSMGDEGFECCLHYVISA